MHNVDPAHLEHVNRTRIIFFTVSQLPVVVVLNTIPSTCFFFYVMLYVYNIANSIR